MLNDRNILVLDAVDVRRSGILERPHCARVGRVGRETGALLVGLEYDGQALSIRLMVRDATPQRVSVLWTACNYGGRRPWFRCPKCARRVRQLRLVPPARIFACRACQELPYACRRYHRNALFERVVKPYLTLVESERRVANAATPEEVRRWSKRGLQADRQLQQALKAWSDRLRPPGMKAHAAPAGPAKGRRRSSQRSP